MTSNSANMNISERLAQRVKESELGALIDEDDLGALCRQAIERAFFEERVDPGSYVNRKLPPLILEIAEEAFKDKIEARVEELVAELTKTEAFRKVVIEAMVATVCNVATTVAPRVISGAVTEELQEQVGAMQDSMLSAGLRVG